MMASPADFTGPVNIGNPEECTVRDLAEQIIAQTGARSELRFMPLPQDDPRKRQPDITLARSALGWQPSVRLQDGLAKTIAYFDALLSQSALREPAVA